MLKIQRKSVYIIQKVILMAVCLTRIHIYKNENHLEFYIIINSFLDLLSSKLLTSWNSLAIIIFVYRIFLKTDYQ